jgi:hypothetical protein
MNSQHDQFIGMYNNVFADGFCNHVITEFDRLTSNNNYCGSRKHIEGVNKTYKDDTALFIEGNNHEMCYFNNQHVRSIFYQGLQDCFNVYTEEYDILKNATITCTNLKLQKTNPGQGYHVWHFEQGPATHSARIVTYMCYLNTITDAGETEFLYQKLRIPPKENTMILWPAAYTHTHRGNVVHGSTSKYVVTGWFHLE